MSVWTDFILAQEARRRAPRPARPEGPGREHAWLRTDERPHIDDIGNDLECTWECARCHAEFSAIADGEILATEYRPCSADVQCSDGYSDVPPACVFLFSGPADDQSVRDVTLAQLERIGGWVRVEGADVLHRYRLNRKIEDPTEGDPRFRREMTADDREPQVVPNHTHDWTLAPARSGRTAQEATCSGCRLEAYVVIDTIPSRARWSYH